MFTNTILTRGGGYVREDMRREGDIVGCYGARHFLSNIEWGLYEQIFGVSTSRYI